MALDEVNAVLGPGRLATQADMNRAFGKFSLGAAGKWMEAGRQAGVTSWRQWQNGDESIFVGFDKGKRTGKDRAITSFWVKPHAQGFDSDLGILPLPAFFGGDPDDLADERDEKNKIINDPKFKAGDPKKLLVGDGSIILTAAMSSMPTAATSAWAQIQGNKKFTAADEIELQIPPGGDLLAVRHSRKVQDLGQRRGLDHSICARRLRSVKAGVVAVGLVNLVDANSISRSKLLRTRGNSAIPACHAQRHFLGAAIRGSPPPDFDEPRDGATARIHPAGPKTIKPRARRRKPEPSASQKRSPTMIG